MNHAEIDALTTAFAPVVKEFVAKSLRERDEKIRVLESNIAASMDEIRKLIRRVGELTMKEGPRGPQGDPGLAGEDGKDGRDGKDVEPQLIVDVVLESVKQFIPEIIADSVTESVAKLAATIPIPENGKDGAPGRDGVDGQQGEQGPPGNDGAPGRDGAEGAEGPRGERGEPGPAGKDGLPGKDGIDGRDGVDGVAGADGTPGAAGADGVPGVPGARGADGAAGADGPAGADGKDGAPGRDGRDGLPGINGKDGLGFDEMEPLESETQWGFQFRRGADVKAFMWDKPQPIPSPTLADWYRGIWKQGEYKRGDTVTLEGGLWLCKADGSSRPGTSQAWQLIVKRGTNGRDGKDGERGPQGVEGKPGRDLTQIGPDGQQVHRW